MSDTIQDDTTPRAKALFLDALERPAEEREAFVRTSAETNAALRDAALRLLASHEEAEASDDFDRLTFTLDWQSLAGDTPASLPDISPNDTIGDYQFVQRLGTGGHGEVWQAQQLRPVQREVAIKLLARVDDRLRDRFAFERQALARLDHPDVARVLDAGDHDGRAFLVVELAPGRPITEFCEAEQLDADERIALFARVCDAVAHAHARGLLHCDLKPSNVLVWRDTNEHDIRLKVIDFGIARLLGADDAEGVVGTPAYMSPEQAGNGAIDVRSDVYALGLLLHALLGGANPVAAETKSKSRRALVQTAAAAPRPEPLQGNVPREADWIIERATEPEPDARYETVARLADDVKRVLDRRPVAAGPATLSYYVQRHAARNKPLAAAIAVAALILLGGIGATAYQAIRATNAERQALEDRDAAEATSRFLQRVLFSARPDFRNPEAAAAFVEAVDRARDGLATDLRGNPEVRSELLDMIGMIYFESNRYAEARPLLEEAYTLRRGLFGPDDARTLRSHEQFAGVLRYLREHDQAIEHASEVVRRGETVGLPRDEVILRNARLTLSESRLRRRAPGDLEGMRELALDARRRMEATSPRSVAARENLSRLMLNYADGILEFANEQNPELRQEFPEFLTLGYELIADIPMGTSRSMLQLNHLHANLLARSGEWFRALEIYKELIPMIDKAFEPHQSPWLNSQTSYLLLRAIYETRDAPPEQVDEILSDLRRLFELTRDRNFVHGAAPYSMVLWNAGRFEEVRDVSREIIAMGPEKPHTPRGAFEQAQVMLTELRQMHPDLFDVPATQPSAAEAD